MSNTKDAMNEQLGQAKILPLLVRLAIPATAAQLVNALYSIVDRMYIGPLPGDGTLALSGIGLTFPITMLIAAFSCLPGMGGAPLASIALGGFLSSLNSKSANTRYNFGSIHFKEADMQSDSPCH